MGFIFFPRRPDLSAGDTLLRFPLVGRHILFESRGGTLTQMPDFAKERDWDQLPSPGNLLLATMSHFIFYNPKIFDTFSTLFQNIVP